LRPDEGQIFTWIEDLVEIGLRGESEGRRTGTLADWESAAYIRDRFEAFGLQAVGYSPPEGADVYPFTADDWGLTVHYGGVEESIDCYPVQYVNSTDPEGISARMVYVGDGSAAEFEAADVEGKIVLVDIYYPWVPLGWIPVYYFDDPVNQSWYHAPLYSNYPSIYARAVQHGAAGWIGIYADQLYADGGKKFQAIGSGYDGSVGSIPALWIDKDDGAYLKDLVTTHTVEADLLLDAEATPSVTYNVVGVLPGSSDDVILIGAHYDGTFDGATDNAVGVGILLATAKHLAQLPAESRDKTWVFLCQSGHEAAGMVGARSFIDYHKDDIMDNLLIYLNIDHLTAIETDPEQMGEYIGMKAVTLCAVPDHPIFIDIITTAVSRYLPKRVMVAPDWNPIFGTPSEPIWYNLGYRVCDFISGPSYYHTTHDTLDKIDRDELVPSVEFYVDVVRRIDGVPSTLIDTCPPLPTPIYYGTEPTPSIPRTLYSGFGSINADGEPTHGNGVLFVTEDMIHMGVDEADWIVWDIVRQWQHGHVKIYECHGEPGRLLVRINKDSCVATGPGVHFLGSSACRLQDREHPVP
jgi:Zn-dependent M28 family amino/carboxypeptidase